MPTHYFCQKNVFVAYIKYQHASTAIPILRIDIHPVLTSWNLHVLFFSFYNNNKWNQKKFKKKGKPRRGARRKMVVWRLEMTGKMIVWRLEITRNHDGLESEIYK